MPYTILDAVVDGGRLTFHVSVAEHLRSFCQLQTSYPHEDGVCHCLPNLNGRSHAVTDLETMVTTSECFMEGATEDELLPVSCVQFELCSSLCGCDATGCDARTDATPGWFDIEIDGVEAQGFVDEFPIFLDRIRE
jgi:hypothetical protein